MRQERLNLTNLKMLDMGMVEKAFEVEQERIVKDILDRPMDDTERTVILTFAYKPVVDVKADQIHAEDVMVSCTITGKVPKRASKVYLMKPKADGALAFHPDLPDEPEGSTLYDADSERRDHNT